MKVLYLHQYFSTPNGAAGTRSYDMAKKLIKRGHSVTMVCNSYEVADTGIKDKFSNGFRRGNVDGIDVIEFDLQYSNSLSFAKRIMTFARFTYKSINVAMKEDYDILFATSTPLTVGIPGVISRIIRGKPFIFEVRDLWPELPIAMGIIKNPVIIFILKIFEKIIYKSSDRLVGLSPGIVRGIEREGVSKDKIRLIPNGSDLKIFRDVFPKKLNQLDDSDFLAIYSGTHGIANHLDSALNAAIELKKRNHDAIKFAFIGAGKQKKELMEKAKDYSLENCIFVDPIPKLELIQYLKSADIGMQILKNIPAFYDGTSPNKFFEYLASGLPVINNYPGWLAELIISENLGFVVEPNNPIDFADKLEFAYENQTLLLKMRENCLRVASSSFDREKLSGEFSEWIETL